MFYLVILLVLAALGLAPAAFEVWLGIRTLALTPWHLVAISPGAASVIFTLAIRRSRPRSGRVIPGLHPLAAALGIIAFATASAAWIHLCVTASILAYRAPAAVIPPIAAALTLIFLAFHAYLAILVAWHMGSAVSRVIQRHALGRHERGDPILVHGDDLAALSGAIDEAPLALSHDARCGFDGSMRCLVLGLALVGTVEARHVKTLVDFARARRRLGDEPWARSAAEGLARVSRELDRHEFVFTPFSIWYWIVWVGRAPFEATAPFAAALAEPLAIASLEERGAPIREALHAQIQAAIDLHRRIWTATQAAKESLLKLEPERPTKNLYRVAISDAYARHPVDWSDLARVTGLSAARCAEIARAANGDRTEEPRPAVEAAFLEEYEEEMTQRILSASLIEYRLRSMALGGRVDRRTL